jgi:hypothetical protein
MATYFHWWCNIIFIFVKKKFLHEQIIHQVYYIRITQYICSVCHNHNPHSWLIIIFVTRLTWWVAHVDQELPILPEHLSPPPDFSEVRVAEYLVFCVMLSRWLFGLLSFYVVCPSSICGVWLLYWYLQQILSDNKKIENVQISNWNVCTKPWKRAYLYMCSMGIEITSVSTITCRFGNCSDSAIYFCFSFYLYKLDSTGRK